MSEKQQDFEEEKFFDEQNEYDENGGDEEYHDHDECEEQEEEEESESDSDEDLLPHHCGLSIKEAQHLAKLLKKVTTFEKEQQQQQNDNDNDEKKSEATDNLEKNESEKKHDDEEDEEEKKKKSHDASIAAKQMMKSLSQAFSKEIQESKEKNKKNSISSRRMQDLEYEVDEEETEANDEQQQQQKQQQQEEQDKLAQSNNNNNNISNSQTLGRTKSLTMNNINNKSQSQFLSKSNQDKSFRRKSSTFANLPADKAHVAQLYNRNLSSSTKKMKSSAAAASSSSDTKRRASSSSSSSSQHRHHHHSKKSYQREQRIDPATQSTQHVISQILEAVSGVFACRFIALLVPDELRLRELRCVAYGGSESASRTQESFSSSSPGAASLLVHAASLALHHNLIVNCRIPQSGDDSSSSSDDDDANNNKQQQQNKTEENTETPQKSLSATTSKKTTTNILTPTPPSSKIPSSNFNQNNNNKTNSNANNNDNVTTSNISNIKSQRRAQSRTVVSSALCVPIPGPNNYPVAVLHIMDRSYGVENFSQEDEAVAWCYARLVSRVIGAHDAKRNKVAPDRKILKALTTVLRTVESVDGNRIRKLLDGDLSDINLTRAATSTESWEEITRAPPVFRTHSGRVSDVLKKLGKANVLFTTKASEAKGSAVECEYHLPGTDLPGELLPICVLTDHIHRVADAWYRTAALLAESRSEVAQMNTEVQKLTQEVNSYRLKVDVQRGLLTSSHAAARSAASGGVSQGAGSVASGVSGSGSGAADHGVKVETALGFTERPSWLPPRPSTLKNTSNTSGGGGSHITRLKSVTSSSGDPLDISGDQNNNNNNNNNFGSPTYSSASSPRKILASESTSSFVAGRPRGHSYHLNESGEATPKTPLTKD